MLRKVKKLISLKTKIKIYRFFNPETEFTLRIKKRFHVFWNEDDSEIPILSASDSIETWRLSRNWQRNLENKRNSREFALKHGFKVPTLYWIGNDLMSIDFNVLPKNYVIKPVIGYSSKCVFLMMGDVNLLDGKVYSPPQLIEAIQAYTGRNQDVEFIIEEFVADELGNYRIPIDYKFYMFNGIVGCIQVINRVNIIDGLKLGSTSYYDERWNKLGKIKSSSFKEGLYQEAPTCFEEMLHAAKVLSRSYGIFVRVDFYATSKGAIFGEFSPTPSGGRGFTRYGSKLLITKWDKYCAGLI